MNRSCLFVLFAILLSSCQSGHTGSNSLFPVKSGAQYGYVDRTGKATIPFKYSRAGCFEGGMAVVATYSKQPMWGYIDESGKYIIEPLYSYATSFSEGLAFVVPEGDAPRAIDKNGIEQFSLPEAQSAENFSEGLAAYSILGPEGETWGFVNKDGKVKIKPQFSAVGYFSNGLCGVMNKNGRWGYINKKAEIVIDFQYDNVQPFDGGKGKVAAYGKWGVINEHGNYVLPPGYADLDIDGEKFLVKQGGKWGWLDNNGKEIIPMQFADAYPFNGNKFAAVKSGNKWGYINEAGKFAIAPQFDFAFGFDNDLALVEVNGKYGFIDNQGQYAINPDFDHVPVDYYIRYFARTSAFYNVKTDVNEPRSIAYKWLTGFYHMSYEEASKYATEDTRALLDQFASISDMISDSSRQRMSGLIIGIKGLKESGNRAIVTYTLSDNRNKEQLLFLIRTNNKWRVQFSKNEEAAEDSGQEG
ncbi:MAG: WG repeat-containing protein [Taibaiella sp.]|nr:WG repeat-containing protein [Taibaiella sp.]